MISNIKTCYNDLNNSYYIKEVFACLIKKINIRLIFLILFVKHWNFSLKKWVNGKIFF